MAQKSLSSIIINLFLILAAQTEAQNLVSPKTNHSQITVFPAQLSEGDIKEEIQALRYHIRKKEDSSLIWASNPKQNFRSSFNRKGLTLETKNPEGRSLTSQWELKFIEQTAVTSGEIHHEGQKISLKRPSLGLTEWYVNRANGLEHGFTISNRPLDAGEQLNLEIAVTGAMYVNALTDGQSVQLIERETEQTILNYSGLKVWDAKGNQLKAYMESNISGDKLSYTVEDENAIYPITIDPTFSLNQQAYLKASNTGNDDNYGISVALSGDTIVIGADEEDSSSSGINGDESDNSLIASGAAYVYVRNGGTWSQQAYLKASNPGESDGFGSSLAISGDTIVVGSVGESSDANGVDGDQNDESAPTSGAAYVFVREGTTWRQQAYLKASNSDTGDEFATSLAISGDTIVVGALGEESAAQAINGNQDDNTTLQAGAAYVFTRRGETWSQEAYLKPSNTGDFDSFGNAVAISEDTLVVGALNESSSASGVNGEENDDSMLSSGAAYVFQRNNGVWSQQAYLKASNTEAFDTFGNDVSISGNTIVVSSPEEDSATQGVNGDQSSEAAPESGAAYIFIREGVTWTQQAYLKASNTEATDNFGARVAISGENVVIGASFETSNATGIDGDQDDNSADSAGAAYLFTRRDNTWQQEAYLKSSNIESFDFFGTSVAISGDTLAISSPGEDSSSFGVNGTEDDNSLSSAGAAYVFVADGARGPSTAFEVLSTEVGLDGVVTIWFEAEAGRTYQVEYSDDLLTWSESPFRIVADAPIVSWRDSGSPVTATNPADANERYYRVRELASESS